MNSKVKFFLEIEEKYKMNSLSIGEYNYWNYERFSLWNYNICSQKYGLQNGNSFKENKIVTIFRYFLSLVKYSKPIYKDKDILIVNSPRRVKEEGIYNCIYTDWISQYFDSICVLELPFNNRHLKPTKTHNLCYLDRYVFLSYGYFLFNRIFRRSRYKSISKAIEQDLKIPFEEMRIAYDWNYDLQAIADNFTKNYFRYMYLKPRIERIVAMVQPKIVVEVVHYSLFNMILNEVSRAKKIPIIELQHGSMHEEHIAYIYNHETLIKQFPDYLFLFSKYWTGFISPPTTCSRLIEAGFPYFERRKEYYQGLKCNKNNKRVILFLSQGTIGIELSKLALELSNVLNKNEYEIIFKLHPSEYHDWESNYSFLLNTDIKVIDNNGLDLYYYFSVSDYQVGVYSTSIYEGLGFGLKTLIYTIGHYKVMEKLIDLGYAKYISNVNQLTEIISNDSTKNSCNCNDFWLQSSEKRIVGEMKKIIEGAAGG